MDVDMQLQTSTIRSGPAYWKFKEGEERLTSWRTYPILGLSIDMGSDGVVGYSALANRYGICAYLLCDPSQAAKNSMDQCLKSCTIWER